MGLKRIQVKAAAYKAVSLSFSNTVKLIDNNGVKHRTNKAPLTGGGMGAGQRSLPYEEFIDREPCKLVTEFSTISTDHCNQTGGIFIKKNPIFFSEVVTCKKNI